MKQSSKAELTIDLMAQVRSDGAADPTRFVSSELKHGYIDETEAGFFSNLLNSDIDWRSGSVDDPVFMEKVASVAGGDADAVRETAGVFEDAWKAPVDEELPWIEWMLNDPCLGDYTFLIGADFRCDAPDDIERPAFMIGTLNDGERHISYVSGTSEFSFPLCRMRSLRIPYTVEFISVYGFPGCYRFERFDVDPRNENYSSDEQGLLYDKSGTVLEYIPNGLRRVRIGKNVRKIDEQFLEECVNSDPRGGQIGDCGGYWDRLLEFIEVDPENPWFRSDDEGILYDADGNELIVPDRVDIRTAESEYEKKRKWYAEYLDRCGERRCPW